MVNVTPDKPRATNRSDLPGTYDPKIPIEETRRPPDIPERFAEAVPPKSLARDRTQPAYYAYSIAPLLRRAGRNRVEIRLAEPETVDPPNWGPRLAIDGEAAFPNGRRLSFTTNPSSRAHPNSPPGTPRLGGS